MTKTNRFAFVLAVVLAFATIALGQTATTSTTLSSAITSSSQQQIVVASATNMNAPSSSRAGSKLYIDREVMNVSAVNGTTISVIRGVDGSLAAPHVSGATVYVGYAATAGNPTALKKGLRPAGACTAANEAYLPQLNIDPIYDGSGAIMDCFGGQWQYDLRLPLYTLTISPQAQRSASSPTAGSVVSFTAQAGGAQSATSGNGANGGAASLVGGAGGAGGSSSGVGGSGGAVTIAGGASAGTVTSGDGGAVSITGGASANGSSAAGNGGNVSLRGGNVGTGGTGVVGKVRVLGAADATKILVIDPSGNSTATTSTLALSDSSAHTHTLPNATGTISQQVNAPCAAAGASCTETVTAGMKVISGISGALNGASPSVAAVTFSTGFTSSSSYVCTASPNGNTAAVAAGGIAITYTSATVVTFTSANAATAAVSFICVGS